MGECTADFVSEGPELILGHGISLGKAGDNGHQSAQLFHHLNVDALDTVGAQEVQGNIHTRVCRPTDAHRVRIT